MELFKNTDFDFLGKKWIFIALSLVLLIAGGASWLAKGGLRYGIDFKGGAHVYVKFTGTPPVARIRQALSQRISGGIEVQQVYGGGVENEVMIGTELKSDQELQDARRNIVESLSDAFGQPGGKLDFNNAGAQALADRIRGPLINAGVSVAEPELQDMVKAMLSYRDTEHSGLITNFDELSHVPGVTPKVISVLKQEAYLAPFSIRNVEVVGPKIGAELRQQAVMATLYALGGMLIYIAFRFEWIYGVAAVIAVFHDVLITLGLFSIFSKEISLTVIAALLTLIGYSMNDTIVVFDRMRENLKIVRREKFDVLLNLSINQTLSRTVLTSGLTFLTAMALFLFGGQVLNGFAFALVVGIIVGTYSSIFIASPVLVGWYNLAEGRKRKAQSAKPARRGADVKGSASKAGR